jgi:predicted acetyltransferase
VPELALTNPVPVDEADGWVAAFVTTLFASIHDEHYPERLRYWRSQWNAERTWGVHDGGRWVATLTTQPRSLTVPAGATGARDLEADAVTAVTVAATHRRRGLLRRMITASLAAATDRGDALSMLIAAEWPIYGRYGYAPATLSVNFELQPRRTVPLLAPPEPGRVRGVDAAELYAMAPTIFDAARRQRPGQVDRRGAWWARRLGQDGWQVVESKPNWVLHEGPDGPDGLLGWHTTRDFDLTGPLARIEVDDFSAGSDSAYTDLWSYLCSIDAVERVTLGERMLDEPIRWRLRDGRALRQTHTGDFLWIRLLDVAAALSARGYAVPGRVVLDVVDDSAGGYAHGRVLLDTDGSEVTCRRTDAAPDLRLDQRVLASIYLGGHRLRTLAAVGLVEELTGGALDRVDVMFATSLAPVTQTWF